MAQQEVLKVIESSKIPISTKEIQKKVNINFGNVNTAVLKLFKQGYVKREKIKREGEQWRFIYSVV